MNRHIVVGTQALSKTQQTSSPIQLSRSISSRTSIRSHSAPGNVSSIKEWLASFNNNPEIIPSRIVKVEHDRTKPRKLICRAPIDALREYVPQEILDKVQKSHYKRSSDAIVTTSNESSFTESNRRDCIRKLHAIFWEIAKDIITESSPKPPPSYYSSNEKASLHKKQNRLLRRKKSEEKAALKREAEASARGRRQ